MVISYISGTQMGLAIFSHPSLTLFSPIVVPFWQGWWGWGPGSIVLAFADGIERAKLSCLKIIYIGFIVHR
jgi:hypothetical protein